MPALARKFDLEQGALFQTELTEVRWDDSISRWIVLADTSHSSPRVAQLG